MTLESQRLAIARFCKDPILSGHDWIGRDDNRWFECVHCKDSHTWGDFKDNHNHHPSGICPGTDKNYPEDLNAMRDAESSLNDTQATNMHNALIGVLFPGKKGDPLELRGGCGDFLFHASATERAEALLRSVGKWEESV